MLQLIPTANAAEGGINIHLAPDVVGQLAGIPITNTLIASWVAMIILIITAYLVGRKVKLIPNKLQNLCEAMIGAAYDYMAQVFESKELAKRFFPLIMTLFLFILAMNWVGLLPGVDSVGSYLTDSHGDKKFIPFLHPAATDLNVTLALSLVAFLAIQTAGITILGFFKYAGKFIRLQFLLKPTGNNIVLFFIGLIELISEIARLISFSFRLFGNIFAGKTMLVIAIFFVPYILPVPILAFELFVGLIQAFIFAILTLFFIKIAIDEPH